MTPLKTQTELAAILDRLKELEDAEASRKRAAEEHAAIQKRLADLKNDRPNREVRDLGTAIAYRQCSNPHCSDFDVQHEVQVHGQETVQFTKDSQGNVTSTIENSWRHWNLVNPEESHCGSCGRNVGFVGEPGSINVLENADDVRNNRDAYLERMRRKGKSREELAEIASRWA